MGETRQSARERLAELGIAFDDAAWDALPGPARRRLALHPTRNDLDRRCLRDLARWLTATFPPGWDHAG